MSGSNKKAVIDAKHKKREIALTKALGEVFRKKYPKGMIFCNKCPSRSSIFRNWWKNNFGELCPPLQPEMDLIIWEPPNLTLAKDNEKLRAIEIKYFRKNNGKVNQSFYKGIEQSLAMLQWGFDSVALWQFFDESFSDFDLCSYGGRTWLYVHDRLNLPIDYTIISVVDSVSSNPKFLIVQPDWDNFPEIKWKREIEEFPVEWRKENPFRYPSNTELYSHPLLKKFVKEANYLRNSIMNWLEIPGHSREYPNSMKNGKKNK